MESHYSKIAAGGSRFRHVISQRTGKKINNIFAAFIFLIMVPFAASAYNDSIDDSLGINITLYSNDGVGNFTLRVDEYFSSDMRPLEFDKVDPATLEPWGEGPWSSTYTGSGLVPVYYGRPFQQIPGGRGLVTLDFQGIVDSGGNPTTGFGSSQRSELFINDPTDAAQYSRLFNFSITGFDPALSSSVDVEMFDCCYTGDLGVGDGDSAYDFFSFDPSVVVTATTPAPVPVPAAVWLFASGLVGLIGLGKKSRKS